MHRREFLYISGYLVGSGLLMSCGIGDRPADLAKVPQTMQLDSPAFSSGGAIPIQQACHGGDRSPALSWSAPPAATQSLVLIVNDPDAPLQAFVHWLVYNLPATIRQLPEGLPTAPTLTNGGKQGKNDFGRYGYGGPCPPSGTHRYFFRIYALDTRLNLSPEAAKGEVFEAMAGHVLAAGELLGNYSHPS